MIIDTHVHEDNRGMGENMKDLSHLLTGIESFNRSTLPHHNLQSYTLATELNIPSLGASDAHHLEKLGTYATRFISRFFIFIDL